jgi:hypothetical protein
MTKPEGASVLTCVPLTSKVANDYVARWHRHHGPIPGGFAWWAVGAIRDGEVVGVAIAGRPTNRNNDDGQTVEVLRVATDGTVNACSVLYGACARAAKAIGARRIITYTLDDESGASLRGAGWERQVDGITSWWTHAGSRTPAVPRPHYGSTKVRWAVEFRPAVRVREMTETPKSDSHTLGLTITALAQGENR